VKCACAILPSVVCPAELYFYTLSHKQQDFRGEKKACFDFIRNICLKYFSFSDELSEI
jgi:hypothetical protein